MLLAGLWLASGVALASGLQVSPVSLTLQANRNAGGLWLSNTGDGVVHAQVRVYHWSQKDGKNQLAASRGLVISPPMLALKPGERHLIRVIRIGAPPSGSQAVEDSYRLAIDELPVKGPDQKGLQFVLHYSVPIFIEPMGVKSVAPQLDWTLKQDGKHVVLTVTNQGTAHAQLAKLSFVDTSGQRTVINGGLMGYVLPGSTMHWTLKQPLATFVRGGTIEARINGVEAKRDVSLARQTP